MIEPNMPTRKRKRTIIGGRKSKPKGFTKKTRYACKGKCGREGCDMSFDWAWNLKIHLDPTRYPCPVSSCSSPPFSQKGHMEAHVRTKANAGDAAHQPYAQEHKPRLGPPPGVVSRTWNFVYHLVYACIAHDIGANRAVPASQTGEDACSVRRAITIAVLEAVRHNQAQYQAQGQDILDHAGGRLPPGGFVLHGHALFQLSLDRKDNDQAHFPEGAANVLSNLNLVVKGINTTSNLVVAHGANTAQFIRNVITNDDRRVYTRAEIEGMAKRDTNKAYQTFKHGMQPKRLKRLPKRLKHLGKRSKAERDALWKHVLDLWEQQQGRCAISGIPMSIHPLPGQSHPPFQCSLDAIDPTKGHVQGNLRWIVRFLNSTNRATEQECQYDTDMSWTRENFRYYFGLLD